MVIVMLAQADGQGSISNSMEDSRLERNSRRQETSLARHGGQSSSEPSLRPRPLRLLSERLHRRIAQANQRERRTPRKAHCQLDVLVDFLFGDCSNLDDRTAHKLWQGMDAPGIDPGVRVVLPHSFSTNKGIKLRRAGTCSVSRSISRRGSSQARQLRRVRS